MKRQLPAGVNALSRDLYLRPRLWFLVESSTDVRLVEGLAEMFDLKVVTRQIGTRLGISQKPATSFSIISGPPQRVRFARLAAREIQRHRDEIDVLLVQGYSVTAMMANLSARLYGLPSIMLVCSPTEEYYRCRLAAGDPAHAFRQRELSILKLLARVNARVGQEYVVLSEYLADVVRDHGGRRQTSVIPLYGVDTERFSPGREAKSAIRARLGLPTDGKLIFFSSRIAPEKDADTLLTALRTLHDRGYKLRLLHRSGGYEAFLDRAASLGVEALVIATDAVHPNQDLADSYRACDVCVQASRAEGLGFSALEALACEIPVVAAAVGGLRETIVDGRTGWTYPVSDAETLALKLEEVFTRPDEAARRAREGRTAVSERFERRVVFAQFAELVDAAIRRSRGS